MLLKAGDKKLQLKTNSIRRLRMETKVGVMIQSTRQKNILCHPLPVVQFTTHNFENIVKRQIFHYDKKIIVHKLENLLL